MNFTLRSVFSGLLLAAALLVTDVPAQAGLPASVEQTEGQAVPEVISQIISVVGLKPRFEVLASTEVDNAAAVVLYGRRFILYNPEFVEAVNNAVQTDWAGVSVIAHEIGHHLNGHTLSGQGSNLQDELEADEFSGFVLRKMGAPLADAQAAMRLLAQQQHSDTHPGRASRLAAISKGWHQAQAQLASAPAIKAMPARVAARQPEPLPQPVAVKQPALSSKHIVGKLVFDQPTSSAFYITTRLNVVQQSQQQVQVVGKLTETSSAEYPFLLTSDRYAALLISADGIVVNKQGKRVGKLQQV